MSKTNNKGFLLAESLIVSTFVLTVLIFLFVQFRNLMTNYKKSYIYNSVEDIYSLGSMADYLKNSNQLNNLMINLGENLYIEVYKDNNCVNENPICNNLAGAMELDYLIYTDSDIGKIKKGLNNTELSQDMKDFIAKVDATEVENKGRLIAKFKNGHFATIAVDTATIVMPFTGTVYRWSTNTWFDGTTDISSLVSGTDYTTNASTLNKTYYLKHDVVDDIVTASYVCFVSDTEHCMKGGDNGDSFEANTQIIRDYQDYYASQNPSCAFTGLDSICSGGGSYNMVDANSYGDVSVYRSFAERCIVDRDGYSYCN